MSIRTPARQAHGPSSNAERGLRDAGADAVALFLALNLWLVVASVLMVGVTAVSLGIPIRAVLRELFLPGFAIFFVYVRDRRSIDAEDRLNHPRRTRLVETYDRPLYATELLAVAAYEVVLLSVVPLGTIDGLVMLGVAQVPFAVLWAYSSLKGHPLLDSLAVAVAWGALVVTSTLATAPAVSPLAVGAVFLGWVLIVFAGVESRNVDDADGDQRLNRDTLASLLGRRRVTTVVVGLKLLGVGLFWLVGGTASVVLVILYLGFLRVCRTLSRPVSTGR
jgi:hypothetical protein